MPIVTLVKADPRVVAWTRSKGRWIAWIAGKVGVKTDEDSDTRTVALDTCSLVRDDFVNVMVSILTVTVFGPAVPPLLIFIPLGIWAKLCAHLHMHNSSLGKVQSAGVTLAVNLLVQPPTRVWNLLMYLLSCTLTASVFYDFEFAVGPIIFYGVLCAVGQILLWYNSCDTSQRQDNSASPTDIVEFVNNNTELVSELEFQGPSTNIRSSKFGNPNPIMELVREKREEERNSQWFSFQRPSTGGKSNSASGALGDLKADSANKAKPVGASTDRVSIEMNPVGSQEPLWTAPKSKHEVRFAVLPSLNLMHHQLTTSTVAMCFI